MCLFKTLVIIYSLRLKISYPCIRFLVLIVTDWKFSVCTTMWTNTYDSIIIYIFVYILLLCELQFRHQWRPLHPSPFSTYVFRNQHYKGKNFKTSCIPSYNYRQFRSIDLCVHRTMKDFVKIYKLYRVLTFRFEIFLVTFRWVFNPHPLRKEGK